jgi:hypothetical protein
MIVLTVQHMVDLMKSSIYVEVSMEVLFRKAIGRQ